MRFFYFSIEKISSHIFYVNVCRWHFSRIYFCISFSGFPFNRDKFTNSQSHEMYIFWLAGFRLVFNLGNIFFSPGGVGIFFSITSLVVGGIVSNLLGLVGGGTLMVGGGNHLEVLVQHSHLHLFHKRWYHIPIR